MAKYRIVFSSWLKVITDVLVIVLLFAVFIGLYVASQHGVAVRRGFFCDDQSIRHPYKDGTIPSWALTLASVGLPFISVIVGNCIEQFITKRNDSKRPYFLPCGSVSSRCPVPMWLARIGHQLRWFFLGILMTLIVTDIGKMVVGRLRPHFIDVCRPDFSSINCTDEFGQPVYVMNYTCTGNEHRLRDARYSWPSGHSSISAYSFVFLALYAASVRILYQRSAFKMLLILVSLLLAMLTGLSRISDYKHHPTDVLSGWIVGVVMATAVVYYNLYFFSHYKCENSEETKKYQSHQDTDTSVVNT